MTTTIRAAIAYEGAPRFSVETVEMRDPAAHDVVVAVDASAFCYTDHLAMRGDTGLDALDGAPLILGHAAVGRIVEVGAQTHRRVGERVLITATPECGRCHWCLIGRIDQCEMLFVPAPVVGTLADGREVRAPGAAATYAEYTVIRDMQVWPVETDLPDEWLAMFGCGVVSGMGAVVNVARVPAGSSVVVVGCGQEGLWIIQAARARGAATIVAVDPHAARRAVAAAVGATSVIDPADGDADDQVRAATAGRGADYGFDAGGSLQSVRDAFRWTKRGGVVVITSYVRRDSEVELPLFDLALRGRDVLSSQSGRVDMRRDIAQFVPWLENGVVDATAMLGGIRPLREMDATLAATRDRTEITPIVAPHAY